jgi:hypothetical protein
MNHRSIVLTLALTLGLVACATPATAPIPEGITEPVSSVPVQAPVETPALEPDTSKVSFGGLKIFGGFASSQRPNELTVDAGGNVYIVGESDGAFGTEPSPSKSKAGATSAFVMKISPAGITLWIRLIGSTGNDFASKVVVNIDGSVYVAGTAGAELPGRQVGSKSVANFLARFDANGKQLWVNQFGDTRTQITDLRLNSSGEPQLAMTSGTSSEADALGAGAFVIHGSKDGPFKDTRTFIKTNPTAAVPNWVFNVKFDAKLNVYVSIKSVENPEAFSLDQISNISLTKFDANGSRQFNLESTHLSVYQNPYYTVEDTGVVLLRNSTKGVFQHLDRYDSNGARVWSFDGRSEFGQTYYWAALISEPRSVGDKTVIVGERNQYELIQLNAKGSIAKTFVVPGPQYQMDAQGNYYFFGGIRTPGSPECSSVFVSKYNRNFELQ